MVVIDERSRVPPLDEAALERLGHALDCDGVVAAMLIGSQARETSDPLTAVDVTAWREPELDPAAAQELQVRLVGEAAQAIGVEEVDLVMLNHASPLMRYSASAMANDSSSAFTMSGSGWRPERSSTISTQRRCVNSPAVPDLPSKGRRPSAMRIRRCRGGSPPALVAWMR